MPGLVNLARRRTRYPGKTASGLPAQEDGVSQILWLAAGSLVGSSAALAAAAASVCTLERLEWLFRPRLN